ncbi:hypothetical protein JN11_02186 [Mucilaginibacter frigoritolerans]|jgi:hypothetical protein|uniref:Uncharacterized protein n=1 Tax=Mucilaginibacter frigoritolerans TaxID=652788 RepID=A0A562U511_9SPHI|nr:hypothetical protein [Mucilaginibacter frigoritolerans]TWJ00923.1 hypothetical protein JN11_02186 [Mucilaginibacter frigoritolerans]
MITSNTVKNKTVAHQAMVYVYDLNNCASEFGFKADDGWELQVASEGKKKELEKQYYPTVSVKVLPEVLLEFFKLVKERLAQIKSGAGNSGDHSNSVDKDLQYLVAYNPKMLLR